MDRLILPGLYRLAATALNALAIVKPETGIKWHRAGFNRIGAVSSRRLGGRPAVPPEYTQAYPTRGASPTPPPACGERRGSTGSCSKRKKKLGIDVGQTSVAK